MDKQGQLWTKTSLRGDYYTLEAIQGIQDNSLPNIVGIDIAKFFASTVVCTCVLACILLYAPTRCSAVFCDNNTISHKCLSLQRYRVDTTFIMRHLKVGSHILPGGVRGVKSFYLRGYGSYIVPD